MIDLSIVTIVFDNPEGLKKTRESLRPLETSDLKWEWIVVDGSPDTHDRVFKDISSEGLTRVVQEPTGVYSALNLGTSKCSGEFVWHLHSSDVLTSMDHLRRAIERLRESHMNWLYSPMTLIYSHDDLRMEGAKTEISQTFVYGTGPSHPGVLFKRKIFEQFGYFSAGYKIAADCEFFVRLLNTDQPPLYFPECFVGFDMHGLSQTEQVRSHDEFKRATKGLLLPFHLFLAFRSRLLYHDLRLKILTPILKRLRVYKTIHEFIERSKKWLAKSAR